MLISLFHFYAVLSFGLFCCYLPNFSHWIICRLLVTRSTVLCSALWWPFCKQQIILSEACWSSPSRGGTPGRSGWHEEKGLSCQVSRPSLYPGCGRTGLTFCSYRGTPIPGLFGSLTWPGRQQSSTRCIWVTAASALSIFQSSSTRWHHFLQKCSSRATGDWSPRLWVPPKSLR